jgi:hypothetical protein
MDDVTLAKFMAKVEIQPNGCWYWTGHLNQGGYGTFYLAEAGRSVLAHVVSYKHFMDEDLPPGIRLDHLCHTLDLSCSGGKTDPHRKCVHPATLQPVTHRVNVLRGRGPAAINAAKTQCDYGHEFTLENTYVDPDGGRECRTCRRERAEEWLRVHHPGVRHGTETHCPQNHPYAGDNLIITSNGGRACRQCKNDWSREYMRRRRAQAKADREVAELADMLELAVLLDAEPVTLF